MQVHYDNQGHKAGYSLNDRDRFWRAIGVCFIVLMALVLLVWAAMWPYLLLPHNHALGWPLTILWWGVLFNVTRWIRRRVRANKAAT
jgi:hypothetical protein